MYHLNLRVAQCLHVFVIKIPLIVGEKGENFWEFVNFPVDFQQLWLFVVQFKNGVNQKCWQKVVEYLKELTDVIILCRIISDYPQSFFNLKILR